MPIRVDALLHKFRARDLISPEEEQVLHASVSEIRTFDAGQIAVQAGALLGTCTLLCEGFMCRFKDLADGARQIQQLHVAGDFLDLHSFLLKRLDHNVAALTQVTVALVPHTALRTITEQFPHLTRVLWFSTLVDAAINRESILSVGRRNALARIAHLMCELKVRLNLVELTSDGRFPLPLTQADLADATGLTPVHVNRMLKKLRDDGIATFRSREVVIHDWERLQQVAEFDPSYLYIEQQPR